MPPIRFVDMELDDEDKMDCAVPCTATPDKSMMPEYPWGLRLSLTDSDLKKLGITEPMATGGMLHGHFMASVTSSSEEEMRDGSKKCRVELQIKQMCIESEDEENEEAEEAEPEKPARRRLMYNK